MLEKVWMDVGRQRNGTDILRLICFPTNLEEVMFIRGESLAFANSLMKHRIVRHNGKLR